MISRASRSPTRPLPRRAATIMRQNLDAGGLVVPQARQGWSIRVPHSTQNKASGRFSLRQLRQSTIRLAPDLVEQRVRILQIGGVEALGEPAVDVGKDPAGFVDLALALEQAGKTIRCAQFVKPGTLLSGHLYRMPKQSFGLPLVSGFLDKKQVTS